MTLMIKQNGKCKKCGEKIYRQNKKGRCRSCTMKHTSLLRRFNQLNKEIMEVLKI